MPQVKKRKKLYKQQLRVMDGRFGPKKPINNNNFQVPIDTSDNEEIGNDIELDIANYIEEGWGDDDDSGWEDKINLEEDKEIQSKLMMVELGDYFFYLIFGNLMFSLLLISFIIF